MFLKRQNDGELLFAGGTQILVVGHDTLLSSCLSHKS
jgi:hypothetical protein